MFISPKLFEALFLHIREAIRNTWGKGRHTRVNSTTIAYSGYNGSMYFLEVVFILGRPNINESKSNIKENQQNVIIKEGQAYGDIIQIDVEETYGNCFYKGESK